MHLLRMMAMWARVLKDREKEVESETGNSKFPDGAVQALNPKTVMVHLSNGVGVACNAGRPGTTEAPSKSAEWAKSSSQWDSQANPYEFCLNCRSATALTKLGESQGRRQGPF